MAYLILRDYKRVIQPTEMHALTAGDPTIRELVEGSVESEIRSYLIQKYDLTDEFKSLDLWNFATSYKAGQRVYINAEQYAATSTYALNTLVLYGNIIYRCSTAIVAPEAWNAGHWTAIGSQYELFYVTLPHPMFGQYVAYKTGDQVFWKNKKYTAKTNSSYTTHAQELQSLDINDTATGNVFPDDPNTSAATQMWGVGVAYTVAAGTYPSDTTKWTSGDSRNQHLVACYMDIVVYELCKRIAPNNVPEARHNAWTRAIRTLKDFAHGDITAELPVIQPAQGSPIRYGGKQIQQNHW